MKNLKRSIISVLVMLLLVVSAFIPSFAAETSEPASYSSSSNSGQRDVVCTTLDGTSAAAYYAGYEYDTLSNLSQDALKAELDELMTETHDYISSYNDCHYEANRTDCENGEGNVILIYTSYPATMSQWNGWNREHVWPQSLGGDSTTGGGADLHHIRPSDAGVNSSRGNKKYGNVNGGTEKYGTNPANGVLGGTYDNTYFEPLDNVKGDVARICLYVLVRWGSSWGATDITDVFESVDVLLEWCEMDPVDTWEMGRNEVVEDIQGNRNVFIDYPEYAWLIFGREVPDDMITPSGEAMGENVSSGTSTTPGVSTGNSNSTIISTEEVTEPISFANTAQRTFLSNEQQVWKNGNITFTNNKAASTTAVADYSSPARAYAGSSLTFEAAGNIKTITVICNSSSYATALKNSVGSEATVSGSTVTITPTASSSSYDVAKLTAQVRINSLSITYLKEVEVPAPSCEHTSTSTNTVDETCTEDGSITVTCDDCGETVSTETIPATGHNYVDNQCTKCGEELPTYAYSIIGPESTESFEIVGNSITLPAAPTLSGTYKQNYVFAGWAKGSVSDTTTAPELFSAGATVTIDEDTTFYAVYTYSAKGEVSTSYVKTDIADIKSTDTVVITMTTAGGTVYALTSGNGTSKAPAATIITVSSNTVTGEVADNLKWNISNNNGSLTIYVNGSDSTWLYCISDNNGVRVGTNENNTFTIDSSTGYLKHKGTSRYVGVYTTNPDWRCYTNTTGNTANQTLAFYVLSSASGTTTVYTSTLEADESSSSCEHTNTTTTTVNANCTTAGSTTVTCDDCGATVSEQTIPATGHTEVTDVKVDATCTETGLTEGSHCSTCSTVIVAQETIAATGHKYADGVCSVCGTPKPSDTLGLDGKEFYIAAIRSSGNYWYMTNDLGEASTKRYQAVDSGLTTLPGYITYSNDLDQYVFVFEFNSDDGTYCIYAYGVAEDAKYLGHTSDNSGTLVEKADALRFTVGYTDGVYNIHFAASDAERYLALNSNNGSDYFAFYKSGQKQDLNLIPVTDPCTHSNTTTSTLDATCTEDGLITVVCDDCGITVSEETISATGHNYVDGICSVCSHAQVSETLGLSGKKFYIATARNDGNFWYMTNSLGAASTKRYTAVDSGLSSLPLFISSDLLNNAYVFVFEYNGDGTYCIYAYGVAEDAKYLGHTSDNSGTLVEKADALGFTVDYTDGVYNIHFTASDAERYLSLNNNAGNDYFAFYKSGQKHDLALIPVSDSTCEHTNTATTVTQAATCTEDGISVTVCADCKNFISSGTIAALGHDLIDGICSRCGYAESNTTPPDDPTESGWTLVTDVSTLQPGDKIIIVAIGTSKGDFIAGDVNSTYLSSIGITDKTFATLPTGAIEFTLGGSSGAWTLSNSNGKLLGSTAAKSVKWSTGTTTWNITIENGNATIESTNSSYGRILYNVGSPRFTTYTSNTSVSMVLPKIYKYSGEQSDVTTEVDIYGASVTIGSNLALNYYVSGPAGDGAYMVFSMNNTTSEPVYSVQNGEYLVFSFKDIPPQCMADVITATLYDKDGNVLIEGFEFSLKEYATKVLEKYADKKDISDLVADMLRYGDAAQTYKNYNKGTILTDDIKTLIDGKGSNLSATDTDNARQLTTAEGTEIDKTLYTFTACGVRFDFDNKLYVKFKAGGDSEITFKLNGVTKYAEQLEDGTYIFYTTGINATDFDEVFTFELYVDGVLHQTITYSVNSYVYAKQGATDANGDPTALAELVLALYNYGISAKNYKS